MQRIRKASPEQVWKNNLRKYGLTPEEYEKMLEAQGGVCAICGHPPKGQRLSVDHDHSCCSHSQYKKPLCGNCNRGLLCQPCNTALGSFRDREDFLMSAVSYLKNTKDTGKRLKYVSRTEPDYFVRMTQTKLDEYGAPLCPCHSKKMEVEEK